MLTAEVGASVLPDLLLYALGVSRLRLSLGQSPILTVFVDRAVPGRVRIHHWCSARRTHHFLKCVVSASGALEQVSHLEALLPGEDCGALTVFNDFGYCAED